MKTYQNKENQIYSEKISQLAEHTILGLAGTLINSIVIIFIFWKIVDKSKLLIWFIILLLVSGFRIFLQINYKKNNFHEKSLKRWENKFLITLVISGIIWGVSGIIFFTQNSIAHQAFLAFILGGLVAGSVGVYSAMRRAFLLFSIPALFPLIIMYATISDPVHLSMAFMLLLFWSIMFFTALRNNKNLIKTFELKYENIELISDLESEIEARKAAETKLADHINEIERIVEMRTHELQESQLRQNRAVSAGNIGLWDWELGTTKVHYSKEWKQQIGYEDYEIENEFEEWKCRVHPEDLEKALERVQQSLDGMYDEYRAEFRFRHRDGSYRWILAQGSIFKDESGRPVRMLGSHIDITERKRMEEEILKTQKIESLGILAGGIAHDFNNILTTILGNISLAKEQTGPENEIHDFLQDAAKASKDAQKLTRQLLTFSKGGSPVKTTATINNTIRESALFVTRGSKSNCEFHLAGDLWPVDIDVGQISQAINNIVINASQAMPEGGTIQISAGNLIFEKNNAESIEPGKYIKISIMDQGAGIPEKYIGKIFDPYFTTKQKGRGLGLASAYSIVKKHDGFITVESEYGSGTTFNIYLIASKNKSLKEEKKSVLSGLRRVLVMDDEPSLRKLLGLMLSKLGYETDAAKDGVEAIQYYKEALESGNPYDFVILDLTIPGGMGGEETIKNLLEIDPELNAIVSSGYSDDSVMSNFKDYGFKGMIKKPFEFKTFSSVINNVFNENEYSNI